MYIPKHFEVSDEAEIHRFIRGHSFGELVSLVDGELFATHLPFLLSEDCSKLIGHMALANPQTDALEKQDALVILAGAHAYISPNWYSSEGVPTWNYQTVHVYGKIRLLTESQEKKHIVDNLTRVNEAGSELPWRPEYAPTMLRGIIGVELSISRVECKYKISQNRSQQDQNQVAAELRMLGQLELADAMSNDSSSGSEL